MSHFDNTFLTHTVMIHDWLNQPGYATLFCLGFLASTLIPLGSEWLLVTMIAAGYEPVTTVAVATAGNYLGAVVTYLIGLRGGGWLIERVIRVTPEQQEAARNYYRKYGAFSLFFSWLPIVGDPLCLVGGMLRIDFWLFTLLVASGKLLRYAVTAWVTVVATG